MNWKEFLKPNWKKVLLSLIIFILLPVFIVLDQPLCEAFGPCPPFLFPMSLIWTASFAFEPLSSLDILTFITLPIGILISYLISSWLIVTMKFTTQDIVKFKGFLKITKGKIILSVLGWLTIGYILTQIFSSTIASVDFPPLLRTIINYYTLIAYVLLPFTFLTIGLYYATIGTIFLFFIITGLRLDI